ncbi:hypothetical protein [Modestobacter sp. NPDC049651]|uniref:hypothetical protein n=1 Tax=unclassified Modestobacter TaxID=2643866 RepID=UPI003400A79E
MSYLSEQQVTRRHVEELLPLLRLTPAQERQLLALPFPVPFEEAALAFQRVGIDVDLLTDRMGGNP